MVEVNLSRILCDCFKENEEASAALARVLSRLPAEQRETAIFQLCQASGLNITFWKNKLAALGSAKKK
jgi:DNA-directed RNA polymerase specialized sigma24 family protein